MAFHGGFKRRKRGDLSWIYHDVSPIFGDIDEYSGIHLGRFHHHSQSFWFHLCTRVVPFSDSSTSQVPVQGKYDDKPLACWWFQTLFFSIIYGYIWDNHPNWLIFFKMVKTC